MPSCTSLLAVTVLLSLLLNIEIHAWRSFNPRRSPVPTCLHLKKRDWQKRKGEIVIDLGFDDDDATEGKQDLFQLNPQTTTKQTNGEDINEKISFISEDAAASISGMTLREIAKSYGFSLNYLGDFIAAQGFTSLVEVDKKLGDMLTGTDIYELLVALQSQDPAEVNDGYTGGTVMQFARQYDVSYKEVVDLCKEYDIALPFGSITVLHNNMYDLLRTYIEDGMTDDNGPRVDDENNYHG